MEKLAKLQRRHSPVAPVVADAPGTILPPLPSFPGPAPSGEAVLAAIEKLTEKMDKMSIRQENLASKEDLESMHGKMVSKEDLSNIEKMMVSKTDLQKFEASILESTKTHISQAIDPIKSEMFDMKERVQKAEEKWNTDALSLESVWAKSRTIRVRPVRPKQSNLQKW